MLLEVPVDPTRLNAVGDLVLGDPRELRALADPLRLRLFDLVRRDGPVTSATIARQLERGPTHVEQGLRELESAGLVDAAANDDGLVYWSSELTGVVFEIPADEEGQRAARQLSNVMMAAYADDPRSWLRDEEPKLGLEWARAAGLFNARIELAPHELREIQEQLERLLEPYATRPPTEIPDDAATVQILAFFLPHEPSSRGGCNTGRNEATNAGSTVPSDDER